MALPSPEGLLGMLQLNCWPVASVMMVLRICAAAASGMAARSDPAGTDVGEPWREDRVGAKTGLGCLMPMNLYQAADVLSHSRS